MSTVIKDLGAVSAYAYAVEKGYTGTESEFAELMADYAEVGQRAEDAAESALNSKTAAQTAATTATNKASEATTAAQTAETAKTDAQTAKTQADTARDEAVTAKTAAETAQGKAEDAQAAAESVAESIPSDYSQLSEDVSDLKEDLNDIDERVEALEEGGTGSGLTEAVKVALLQIAQKVAYVDAHGQDYYDDLYDALYPPATLVRIDAVYTQSGTVLTTDTLDSLKADLVVTATYTDQTTETVTDYTLSGTLSEGTSTITVSYGGKTDTFTVTVTYSPIPSGYTELEYVHANGAYLNTGYIPNANTALEYKFAITELKASGHIISGTNYYGYGVRKTGTSSVGYLLNRFGTEKSAQLTSYALGTPIEVGMYMDGDNVVVDNDVVTTCEAGAIAAGALSIFTFNGNGNYINVGNLYYLRIYENTTLVREYIPCQRNSDDAIGLYETVNDAFYTSSSRTNFTGPT